MLRPELRSLKRILPPEGQAHYRWSFLKTRLLLLLLTSFDYTVAHRFLSPDIPLEYLGAYAIWLLALILFPVKLHHWLSDRCVRPLVDVIFITMLIRYSGIVDSSLYLLYGIPVNSSLRRLGSKGRLRTRFSIAFIAVLAYVGICVYMSTHAIWVSSWHIVAFRSFVILAGASTLSRIYAEADTRLEGIAEGLKNVATRLESRELATSIAEMLRDRMHADECAVYLVETSRANCQIWAVAGPRNLRTAQRLRFLDDIDDSLSIALSTKSPVCKRVLLEEDYNGMSATHGPETARFGFMRFTSFGIWSYLTGLRGKLSPLVSLVAPFNVPGLEGAIEVRRRRWFTESEESFVGRFTDSVAEALDKSEKRRRRFAMTGPVLGKDLNEALHLLVTQARETLQAPYWTIYIYEPEQERLCLWLPVGIPSDQIKTIRCKPGEGLIGSAFTADSPTRLEGHTSCGQGEKRGNTSQSQLCGENETGPILIVHVVDTTGNRLGVLKIERPVEQVHEGFDVTDEELAVEIGKAVGTVIRLYQDRDNFRRRTRDLEAVIAQQRELMEVTGKRRALEVALELAAQHACPSMDLLVCWRQRETLDLTKSIVLVAGRGERFERAQRAEPHRWHLWAHVNNSPALYEILRSNEPFSYLPDVNSISPEARCIQLEGTRSVCIVPMSFRHEPLGCLIAESTEVNGIPKEFQDYALEFGPMAGAVVGQLHVFTELLGRHAKHPFEAVSKKLHEIRGDIIAESPSLADSKSLLVLNKIAVELDRLMEQSSLLISLATGSLTDGMCPVPTDVPSLLKKRLWWWEQCRDASPISFEADACIPQVECEPDFVSEAFDRLIGNAVSFRTSGSPINVRVEHRNGTVAVVVENEGPGIPEEKMDEVFGFGFSTRRGRENRGLGLWIAKQFIEVHPYASIGITDCSPKHTRFEINLKTTDNSQRQEQ